MTGRTIHVALIGATGVGKSSTLNVLAGKEVAKVNNNAKPCTTEAMEYEVVHEESDTTYCIWDTRGLNEGKEIGKKLSFARMGQMIGFIPDAERELKKLLLEKNPDLALLCINATKIGSKEHWSIYADIYASLREKMKVAVVVTQLRDMQDSTWRDTCEATAKSVFGESPGTSKIEGIPDFRKLDDPKVKDCRDRILTLISRESC